MKAILRRSRISPKKMNLIASLVKNKKAEEAIQYLKFVPKKGASILSKVIQSAAANAENNYNQKKSKLFIKKILVTKGPVYKRSIPISRGRMHPMQKRSSHITVELDVPATQKTKTETPKKIVNKS